MRDQGEFVPLGESHVKKAKTVERESPSKLISAWIAELGDWRGDTLARMRKLIHAADKQVVEEWKWMGTPVREHDGILCTGETYKQVVKLTFARGAALSVRAMRPPCRAPGVRVGTPPVGPRIDNVVWPEVRIRCRFGCT